MDTEKLDYFFTDLELYLRDGFSPKDAIIETIDDYQYVFNIKPTRKRKCWIVRKIKNLLLKLRKK